MISWTKSQIELLTRYQEFQELFMIFQENLPLLSSGNSYSEV